MSDTAVFILNVFIQYIHCGGWPSLRRMGQVYGALQTALQILAAWTVPRKMRFARAVSKFYRHFVLVIIMASVVCFLWYEQFLFRHAFWISQPRDRASKAVVVSHPDVMNSTTPSPNFIQFSVYRDGFAETLKSGKNGTLKIPNILHQTWKDYNVPVQFVRYINSWLKKNPDFEYWFWTDRDAEAFIKMKYPKFYPRYKGYAQNMQRVDAVRYFILYEYGGWYADLDMEALRPLYEISRSHHCVVPLEPWGQAIVIWKKDRLASNAFMGARPRHPFFGAVTDALPAMAKRRGAGAMLFSTGPFLLSKVVADYENEAKKRNAQFKITDSVYLANPEHFLPVADASAVTKMKHMCTKDRSLNTLQKDYCGYLKKMNFANELPPKAYTTHAWMHTYFGYNSSKMVNIFKVVPKAKSVSKMLSVMGKKKPH